MLFSYLIPILYVYFYYSSDENKSVSSVIGSEKCQMSIFAGMIFMGIFTICYELNRGCYMSLFFISTLLIGIYGVILIKENEIIHYTFAGLVFASIMSFMFTHFHQCCDHTFLYSSLYLQIILTIILLFSFYKKIDIFNCEVILILNFACFYIYLHFL
jgi:hypothetical protein